MKPQSSLSFICALLSLSFGCGNISLSPSEIRTDNIHQSYSVTYDEADKRLTSIATFRLNGATGTKLELPGPSQVTHNDRILNKTLLRGTFYTQEWRGRYFKNNHTWKWVSHDGRVFVNSTEIFPVSFGESLPPMIVHSAAYQMTLNAPGTPPSDTITLEISQKYQGNSSHYLIDGVLQGQNQIRFKLDRINFEKLKPGKANFRLRRKTISDLQQRTQAGGNLQTEYLTDFISIDLL